MGNNRICCGFGHREVLTDLSHTLPAALEQAIDDGLTVFLTGGMGEFDRCFSSAVRALKRNRTEIRLILVKPYYSDDLNTNRAYYAENYDEVVIPGIVDDVYPQRAIGLRNRWMVEQSERVIVYLRRDFGGAYKAARIAEKRGIPIVRL